MVAANKLELRTHCAYCGKPLPDGRTRRRKYCEGDDCRTAFNNARRSKRAKKNDSQTRNNILSMFGDGYSDDTHYDTDLNSLWTALANQQVVLDQQQTIIENQDTMIRLLHEQVLELKRIVSSGSTAAPSGNSQHTSIELPPPDFDNDDMPLIQVKKAKDNGTTGEQNFLNSLQRIMQ